MNWQERVQIREAYEIVEDSFERGEKVGPYEVGIDWISKFSPIEDRVWSDIRWLGLPLYPQFPVDKYFIDFADPYRKIAVEVDGREFHKNVEADLNRTRVLERLGWSVFRIPGWATMKSMESFYDEEGNLMPEYYTDCSEGILMRIYRDRYHWWEREGDVVLTKTKEAIEKYLEVLKRRQEKWAAK